MPCASNLQIQGISSLLQQAIKSLIQNDSDIFNMELLEIQNISPDARVLNRQLHEVAINHRLAYYLERYIEGTNLAHYNVDIEYNRHYGNAKMVQTVEGILEIRPDILIHSRLNRQITPQNYLVIEAKKGRITDRDINKVQGLMSDPNYHYLFGFVISYCEDQEAVFGRLFFDSGDNFEDLGVRVEK